MALSWLSCISVFPRSCDTSNWCHLRDCMPSADKRVRHGPAALCPELCVWGGGLPGPDLMLLQLWRWGVVTKGVDTGLCQP